MRFKTIQAFVALMLANGAVSAHPGHVLEAGMSEFAHVFFGVHTNIAFFNTEAVLPGLALMLGLALAVTYKQSHRAGVVGAALSVLSAGVLLGA
ncbi:MAG: hypothetical protein KDI42_02500 [Gammaproteobacteria bacterium]|nr:hypothetical protein [Gammaproteobacteria bacterium]